MKRNDIIVASASPRRREMFSREGCGARICPADIDETLPFDMAPETAVMYLSFAKAMYTAQREKGLIVAADTVVVYEGEIMGKPRDEEEAFRMLERLRGRHHQVITGVCLIDNAGDEDTESGPDRGGKEIRRIPGGKLCLYDVTDVYFTDYTDGELRAYVQTPEPYDKAGGYAIQETFGKYIDHIEGDLDNVIGFPMYRVRDYLERI